MKEHVNKRTRERVFPIDVVYSDTDTGEYIKVSSVTGVEKLIDVDEFFRNYEAVA